MTDAFIGLLLAVLAVSFVGIMAARAAKRHEDLRRSQDRPGAARFRTLDHSARTPTSQEDRNKSSDDAIAAMLSGSSGRSEQR